jgi:site-specific DNA-cytosine methylase
MNALSLFHGGGCFNLAADRANLKLENIYTSDINVAANRVDSFRNPGNTNWGDVTEISNSKIDIKIDILVGGSPCQGFSNMGAGLNFTDPRSKLFFEFVRILEHTKPKYFLLENVRMRPEWQEVITKYLGVKPIRINSSIVSAQSRVRDYWTNIPQDPIEDRNIILKDILFKDAIDNLPTGLKLRLKSKCVRVGGRKSPLFGKHEWDSPYQRIKGKSYIDAEVQKTRRYNITECERLQTMPDNYTMVPGVSMTERFKICGNAWTVNAVAELLKNVK